MSKCDRYKSEHLKTKTCRKKTSTGPKGPKESFQIKTTMIYLRGLRKNYNKRVDTGV